MSAVRHLAHAPITEAIFDFRVQLPADFDPGRFLNVQPDLTPAYPTLVEQRQFQTQVTIRPQGPPAQQASEGLTGYIFQAADGLTMAQFRLDGFTLNRLKPYPGWDSLLPEVLRLWDIYRTVAGPVTCVRVATRFINLLQVPVRGPHVEIASLLEAPPAVPVTFGFMESFLSRVAIRDPARDAGVIITQASQAGVEPEVASVVLDIDASRVNPTGIPEDQVREAFLILRELKNEVFFSAVPETLLRSYE